MPRSWMGLVIVIGMLGCGDSHQAVLDQQIANLKEMTGILREVKDDESMLAAETKIADRANVYRETTRRALALAAPDDDTRVQLSVKVGEMQSAIRGFHKEAARVAALAGGPDFIERIKSDAAIQGVPR